MPATPTYSPNPAYVSDFAGLPRAFGASSYTLPGNRFERTHNIPAIYALNSDMLPPKFPLQSWNDQSGRYSAYWDWFNGDLLNQTKQGEDGELLFRYPLRINVLRDVVRKHASILFGEVPDGPRPLVETRVKARKSITGVRPTETDEYLAEVCEKLVNEVWLQSGGRAIQQEGGEMCQFLGGHVYQVTWQPEMEEEWIVPIGIRSWKADYFLPIWEDNTNYWELNQAYIVYRIEGALARDMYGITGDAPFVTYVEHWTKDKYSIYIDNKAITRTLNGKTITYENRPNPFKKVPFIYIPHLREGSFYGSSHVPDLAGLIQEYNAAMADLSDTISKNLDRQRYIRNSNKRTAVELPNGLPAIDLGMQNPSIHNPPDAFVEDPVQLSEGLTTHPDKIYNQIRRSAFLPPVAEGEDEGSQRSGITLDIRFWPATAHTKTERGFWETGLNYVAKMILRMIDTMDWWQEIDPTLNVGKDFLKRIEISQKWYPQIPRDRQSLVNELLSRFNGDGMSPEMYLDEIGDVENPTVELERIKDWMEYKNKLELSKKQVQANSPLDSTSFSKTNNSIDTSI
jgi:hypothetical protein